MTKVGIIVLNWKQPKITVNLVNSLLKIDHHNFSYQIFLVDNASPDNSYHLFQKKYHRQPLVSLIHNESNLGYVEGNNQGIKNALTQSCDYLLILNNDVLVKKDFLDILVKTAKSSKKLAVFSPKIYFAPGYEFYSDRYSTNQRGKIIWSVGGILDWNNVYGSNLGIDEYDQGQYDRQSRHLDFLSGCCLFIPRQVFKKIGLFDPKYFMYFEDVDFSQKAKNAGISLKTIPNSVIWHLNAQSSGAGGPLHDYFISRNRLLFGFRYAPVRTKLALIRESFRLLIHPQTNHWKKRGIIDFYLGRFGRGSWQ